MDPEVIPEAEWSGRKEPNAMAGQHSASERSRRRTIFRRVGGLVAAGDEPVGSGGSVDPVATFAVMAIPGAGGRADVARGRPCRHDCGNGDVRERD
jgi:hypothetical protein